MNHLANSVRMYTELGKKNKTKQMIHMYTLSQPKLSKMHRSRTELRLRGFRVKRIHLDLRGKSKSCLLTYSNTLISSEVIIIVNGC